MIIQGDNELLAALKRMAAENNCSPYSFLKIAESSAEYSRHALIQDSGPYPREIEEAVVKPEDLEAWPAWVSEMVPPGSQWEKLYWPDGTITLRLVDPRGHVLAAKFFSTPTPTGNQ